MLTEHLFTLILESVNMPAEITAGILSLYRHGLMRLCVSILTLCVCLICLGVRRSFFEQSGMAVRHEPVAVAAGGIAAYGLSVALMLVFVLSVVGFPVAAVIFCVMSFFIFAGQASLGVMLGRFFTEKLHRKADIYNSAFIGAAAIEGVKYLPYIGWPFQYIAVPVLALGAVTAGVSNGYIKKRFYYFPEMKIEIKTTTRKEIRDIIHATKSGQKR